MHGRLRLEHREVIGAWDGRQKGLDKEKGFIQYLKILEIRKKRTKKGCRQQFSPVIGVSMHHTECIRGTISYDVVVLATVLASCIL